MKRSLRFALCTATVVFLTVVPAEMLAHHSRDTKLDRAVEKANSEFILAVKTGDAATIAAPYIEDASFITIDGACVQGRTEIEKMYRDRFARFGLARSAKINSKSLVVDNDLAYGSGYGEIGVLKTTRCRSREAVFSPSGSARRTAIGRFCGMSCCLESGGELQWLANAAYRFVLDS